MTARSGRRTMTGWSQKTRSVAGPVATGGAVSGGRAEAVGGGTASAGGGRGIAAGGSERAGGRGGSGSGSIARGGALGYGGLGGGRMPSAASRPGSKTV